MIRPHFASLCLILVALSTVGCSLKIPGIGKKDDDKEVTPANGVLYASDRALQVGDVVHVEVYKGLRSSSRLFNDSVTVGSDGTLDLGKSGNAKVVGMQVSAAAASIGSQFRRTARTSAERMTVHISSVNGTEIVRVMGGVGRPGVVILGSGMSVKQAIVSAGGKRAGAGTSFVYLSSRGVRKTLVIDGVTGGDPEADAKLRAGDLVEIPAGL